MFEMLLPESDLEFPPDIFSLRSKVTIYEALNSLLLEDIVSQALPKMSVQRARPEVDHTF